MRAIGSSRTDAEQITEALTAFVNVHIMAHGRPIEPGELFETAGVDSMALLRLLLFVEAEFGFWVPDEDLVPENIASTRALGHYLARRLSA